MDSMDDDLRPEYEESTFAGAIRGKYAQRTPSVHDNDVYGFTFNGEASRLTLHTLYRHITPHEYTDVVFCDVVAHYFEHVLSGNILFDVCDVTPDAIVDRFAGLFVSSWRFGWPTLEYRGDLDLLKSLLRENGVKGFDIESSYGMTGWVLCKSCEHRSRDARRELA